MPGGMPITQPIMPAKHVYWTPSPASSITLPIGDPQDNLLALYPSIISNQENHCPANAAKAKHHKGKVFLSLLSSI